MNKQKRRIVIDQCGDAIMAHLEEHKTLNGFSASSPTTASNQKTIKLKKHPKDKDNFELASKIAIARLFNNKEDEEKALKEANVKNQVWEYNGKEWKIKPNFKAGDIVRYIGEQEIKTLDKKRTIKTGTVGTIKSCWQMFDRIAYDVVFDGITNFLFDEFAIFEKDLELAKDEPSFKVGDRVKVIQEQSRFHYTFGIVEVGMLGTIKCVKCNDGVSRLTYYVLFDDVKHTEDDGCFRMYSHDIELVKNEVVKEVKKEYNFKAGDRVEIMEDVSDDIFGYKILAKGKTAIIKLIGEDGDLEVKEEVNPFFNTTWFIEPSKVKLIEKDEPKGEPKFKINDVVKVINNGLSFTTYKNWFRENGCLELEKNYQSGFTAKENKKYLVVTIGKHENKDYCKSPMYAIKDLKGRVYLIEESGLKGENDK